MLQKLKNEKKLVLYQYSIIEDAGITVEVDSNLSTEQYIAIKVDDYYAGLHEAVIPASVDYIVVVDCECNWYRLYILELKNVRSTPSTKSIINKFENTIEDFIKTRFNDIFLNDKYKYKDIRLYLVTSSYQKAKEMGQFDKYIALRKRIKAKDTLSNDSTLSQKIFQIKGKICRIERECPPNPIIKKLT